MFASTGLTTHGFDRGQRVSWWGRVQRSHSFQKHQMIPCLHRSDFFCFVFFFLIFQGKLHKIKDWTYSFAIVAAFNKTSFIKVNNSWQKTNFIVLALIFYIIFASTLAILRNWLPVFWKWAILSFLFNESNDHLFLGIRHLFSPLSKHSLSHFMKGSLKCHSVFPSGVYYF